MLDLNASPLNSTLYYPTSCITTVILFAPKLLVAVNVIVPVIVNSIPLEEEDEL